MKKAKPAIVLLTVMSIVSFLAACSGSSEQNSKVSSSSSESSVFSQKSEQPSESSKQEISAPESSQSLTSESSVESKETNSISQKISEMTIDEKIGQMLMVGIEGIEIDEDFQLFAEKYKPGTIILFGKNITDAEQLTNLTNSIKTTAGDIPYIIGMDEEGGSVTRLPDDVLSMPSALTVAASENIDYCYNAGYHIGEQITSFGLHTGFCPVLDVWSNPDNTVIGDRAYGKNSDDVCKYGIADMRGVKDAGAIPVVKHFPGHGDTETDSHYGLPLVKKTKDELWQSELLPFQSAIKNGVPMIMAAHILCTELDNKYPASMSEKIITELLRNEMGFDGVVITDDLTMGAISENYSFREAAVLSINAGCDILSICFGYDNVKEAFEGIKEAVNSGEISEDRINESVKRILELKQSYNITSDSVEVPDVSEMNSKTLEFQNS